MNNLNNAVEDIEVESIKQYFKDNEFDEFDWDLNSKIYDGTFQQSRVVVCLECMTPREFIMIDHKNPDILICSGCGINMFEKKCIRISKKNVYYYPKAGNIRIYTSMQLYLDYKKELLLEVNAKKLRKDYDLKYKPKIKKKQVRKTISNEVILQQIRDLVDNKPDDHKYFELNDLKDLKYSMSLLYSRFGGIRQAARKAGVVPNPNTRRT